MGLEAEAEVEQCEEPWRCAELKVVSSKVSATWVFVECDIAGRLMVGIRGCEEPWRSASERKGREIKREGGR